MADNEQDPPDTWEARLAYAEELHDYVCRITGCAGRDEHERRTGTSFMAVVTNPRPGSAYGVPPELAEYLGRDFAAPVANAPARAPEPPVAVPGASHTTHVLAFLALSVSLAVEVAQGLVTMPGMDSQTLLGDLSPKVLAVCQLLLVVAAAYGIKPTPRATA